MCVPPDDRLAHLEHLSGLVVARVALQAAITDLRASATSSYPPVILASLP